MLKAIHAGFYGLLHLVGFSWPSEAFPEQWQGMVMPLMTCISVAPIQCGNTVCPGDHKELQFWLWALNVGTRPTAELQNSVYYIRLGYLLHWRHVQPEVPSNLSASVPSASPTLCSMSVLLSRLQPSQNMHLHQWATWGDMSFLFQMLVAFYHGQLVNFGMMCHS